ncbi:MAG: terminase family protein [Prevotellaceae bacterium]|nr:terminase family protein [Prevotellaceae bacterium]
MTARRQTAVKAENDGLEAAKAAVEAEWRQWRRLLREDAPRRFSSYIKHVYPKYQCEWFHILIADKCQSLLDGTLGKDRLMVFMPPQHGKALSVNTPVLTANRGWVRHGDLRAGDIVFSPSGRQVRVQAVTAPYEWECREVVFAQGEGVVASYNHEWGCYIPNSDHDAIYHEAIETDGIAKERRDRSPYIMTTAPLEYEARELPIPPYVLGLWLGDGISSGKRVCKKLADCKFFLTQYAGDIRVYKAKETQGCVAFDGVTNTCLRRAGVLENKNIPREYLEASVKQRLDLLQGLMDTDGSCDTRGTCEITQTRKVLALGIVELLRSLGYKPCVAEGDAKLNGRVVSRKWRISFTPNRDADIFRLPRKLERLRNKTTADRGDKFKHFIKSITPCGRRMVNCIQVEGGYYLCGEQLIATHNSSLISQYFPSWALGRDPDLKIVGASYSASLATRFSREIQRLMETDEYRQVFPDTYISGSAGREKAKGYVSNIDTFETVGHKGFYKAVGVGGSLTGTPADIAIIDDPVKDREEAYSQVYRDRAWNWYNSVLKTRLHNDSKVLFVMTRWHEDDLAGRILQAEGERWEVVTIPAICETEDDGIYHSGRHIGDALWESKHSLEELLEARKNGPSVFAALYQQRPVIEGGNIVKREWFRHISYQEFIHRRNRETVNFYLDTGYAEHNARTDNDPSGIIAVCQIGRELYVTHAKRVWMGMPDLLRFLPQYVMAHSGGEESLLCVEPKANGVCVVQMLREHTPLNVRRTKTPKDSKETRLRAVTPFIEAGRVYLVDGDWTEDFMREVCGFPSQPHDEFVDVLVYALDEMRHDREDLRRLSALRLI